MSEKVLTLDGVEYKLGPLTVDQAEEILEAEVPLSTRAQMRALLAVSLGVTVQEVGKLPYGHYSKLVAEVLSVNGLQAVKGGDVTPGEAQATSPSGPS